MPIRVSRDDSSRTLTITATDPMTQEDWLGVPTTQATMGCWSYALLLDVTGAKQAFGADTIWRVADLWKELVAEHGPRGPVAIVVSDALLHATARMYTVATHSLDAKVAVFRDVSEAITWLDAVRETTWQR